MQKRGYHVFPLKIVCLSVPKNVVGEHFGVSENFWYRKRLRLREIEGEHDDFPSNIFCFTIPKPFVGEPVCASEKFWHGKTLGIRGGEGREGVSRFSLFCRKFFVSQYQKTS